MTLLQHLVRAIKHVARAYLRLIAEQVSIVRTTHSALNERARRLNGLRAHTYRKNPTLTARMEAV